MTRALFLLLGAAVALSACGRPGPPRAPGPREDIIYPRLYPYDPSTRTPGGSSAAPAPTSAPTAPGITPGAAPGTPPIR